MRINKKMSGFWLNSGFLILITQTRFAYCLPELALGRPRITQRPCVCVCVCVSVMTGIELWIYWTDFNATLVTVHFYSLVVHCKIWKELLAPFTFCWGGGGTPDFPIKSYGSNQCLRCLLFLMFLLSSVRGSWLPLEALSLFLLPSTVTVHWHSEYYRCVSTVSYLSHAK